VVVGDVNGIVVISPERLDEMLTAAETILEKELAPPKRPVELGHQEFIS
jgi:regulator of RNase E activity RraA